MIRRARHMKINRYGFIYRILPIFYIAIVDDAACLWREKFHADGQISCTFADSFAILKTIL
jgi:hypothetical protein